MTKNIDPEKFAASVLQTINISDDPIQKSSENKIDLLLSIYTDAIERASKYNQEIAKQKNDELNDRIMNGSLF